MIIYISHHRVHDPSNLKRDDTEVRPHHGCLASPTPHVTQLFRLALRPCLHSSSSTTPHTFTQRITLQLTLSALSHPNLYLCKHSDLPSTDTHSPRHPPYHQSTVNCSLTLLLRHNSTHQPTSLPYSSPSPPTSHLP